MRPKPNIRADTGASSGVPQPVGLLVGTKGAQLHRFRRVLQQAGYRVVAVNVPAEVVRLATEQEVDVILYNSSIPYSALVQGYRSFARRPALIRLHADQAIVRGGFGQGLRGSAHNANDLVVLLQNRLAGSGLRSSQTVEQPGRQTARGDYRPASLREGARLRAEHAGRPGPAHIRLSHLAGFVLQHGVALAAAIVFLVPLLWMVSASLRQVGLPPPRTIEWIPRPLAWENYPRLFEILPLGRYTLNSLFVAAVAVPTTLAVASWAGFAMAQLEHHIRSRLVVLSVGLLMVPITALWLTRFILFTWAGLINTYWALIAPAVMGSSPLFVLLFYWTFRRVHYELWESARLDGANAFAIWQHIALPLARPTILAVGVLAFLLYWSDFINPLLFLKSQYLYTLPVGLQQLQQLDKTNWPLLMAASVVMTGPSVLLFLLVQRYFLQESRLAGIYGR